MLIFIGIVIAFLIYHNVRDKGWCIFGHKWDNYRGFEQIKPHHTAKCVRCGARYEAR